MNQTKPAFYGKGSLSFSIPYPFAIATETPEFQMLPYLTFEMKRQEVERFMYVGFRIMKDVHESCYFCTRVYEIMYEIQQHIF